MSEKERDQEPRRDRDDAVEKREKREPPETARHPAPGIEHEPEPSSENLIPVKDRPGTI
jgi:hypothetical protein